MILLLGSEGSMGKRYQAILKSLNVPFFCEDLKVGQVRLGDLTLGGYIYETFLKNFTGIIIATPTETHADLLRKLIPFRKRILCEKPITKDLRELIDLYSEAEKFRTEITMSFQYQELVPQFARGPSYYDFFRHGKDDKIWDCIQIIGLSKTTPYLADDSPIWKCCINGHILRYESMDLAYINFVKKWLEGASQNKHLIIQAHEKTEELFNAEKSDDRNSSAIYEPPSTGKGLNLYQR